MRKGAKKTAHPYPQKAFFQIVHNAGGKYGLIRLRDIHEGKPIPDKGHHTPVGFARCRILADRGFLNLGIDLGEPSNQDIRQFEGMEEDVKAELHKIFPGFTIHTVNVA